MCDLTGALSPLMPRFWRWGRARAYLSKSKSLCLKVNFCVSRVCFWIPASDSGLLLKEFVCLVMLWGNLLSSHVLCLCRPWRRMKEADLLSGFSPAGAEF